MTTPSANVEPVTTPRPAIWIRIGVLAVSAAQVVTVFAGLWLAVLASGQVLWTTVGFEAVALGAGVVGVLAGLGRVRQGLGLALLCAAGTVLVSGVFGLHFAAGPTVNSAALTGEASASAGRVLDGVVRARVLIAAAMSALAAVAVLTRTRASWRPLGLGLALLVPVLAIGSWLVAFGGAERLVGEIETGVGVARLIAVLFGGLVLFVIASVGGHHIIRAFELTADSTEPVADAKSNTTAANA